MLQKAQREMCHGKSGRTTFQWGTQVGHSTSLSSVAQNVNHTRIGEFKQTRN